MLGLQRKANEEIVIIKDGVEVGSFKIISVGGGKVSIGFDFPKEYRIMHRELLMGEKAKVRP